METKFAPAERAEMEEIRKVNNKLMSLPHVTNIFSAISSISAILNKQRQFVFVSNNFMDFLKTSSMEELLGNRPGEVVGCIHAGEEEGGCGTSESCRVCGAVAAILEAQSKKSKSTREARITSQIDGRILAWDLNITATPLIIEDEEYVVLSIDDISQAKRKANLERVFFHDIRNTIGGINGLMSLFKQLPDKNNAQDLVDLSLNLSHEALDEIVSFQQFVQAENGDLEIELVPLSTMEVIQESCEKVKFHKVARDKEIAVDPNTGDEVLNTDKILLSHTLMNLLKNALEATPKRGKVTIGAKVARTGYVRFSVHNETYMDERIKLQVFQRSFSTKGHNRGVGTYSIKLFVENYLKGSAWFESTQEEGTTFTVELPIYRKTGP